MTPGLTQSRPDKSSASRCHHCCSNKASPVVVDCFGHGFLICHRVLNLSPSNASSIIQWYQPPGHCIRIDQGVGDTMVQSTLESASRSCSYTFMKHGDRMHALFRRGRIMIRHLLAVALLAVGATLSQAQPSLPSSFQAK